MESNLGGFELKKKKQNEKESEVSEVFHSLTCDEAERYRVYFWKV